MTKISVSQIMQTSNDVILIHVQWLQEVHDYIRNLTFMGCHFTSVIGNRMLMRHEFHGENSDTNWILTPTLQQQEWAAVALDNEHDNDHCHTTSMPYHTSNTPMLGNYINLYILSRSSCHRTSSQAKWQVGAFLKLCPFWDGKLLNF